MPGNITCVQVELPISHLAIWMLHDNRNNPPASGLLLTPEQALDAVIEQFSLRRGDVAWDTLLPEVQAGWADADGAADSDGMA